MSLALSPEDVVCTETLVASLRDPDVLSQGIWRHVYITSKPMGSEGATGKMMQGDLAQDEHAKVIYFDPQAGAYVVQRNGNPPPPGEQVPDGDIGALVRSFVRSQSEFSPVYLTVTDAIMDQGVETIRTVIPARQIELFCQHGPDPTARGVPFTSADLESTVSARTVAIVVASIAVAFALYWKFIRRKTAPPSNLPDIRPFVIEQRHGARKLLNTEQTRDDVRAALNKIR